MLSFPRDWIVDIPGYAAQEITELVRPGRPEADDRHDPSGRPGITPNYYVTRRLRCVHEDGERARRRLRRRRPPLLQPEHRTRRPRTSTRSTSQPGYQLMRGTGRRSSTCVTATTTTTRTGSRASSCSCASSRSKLRPVQHRAERDPLIGHGEGEPQDHRQEADVARRHGAVRQHAPLDPEEQHGQRAVRRPRASDRRGQDRGRPVRDRRPRSTSSSTPTRRWPTAPPTRPPARSRRPRPRRTTRPRSRSRCATATARSAPPPTSRRSS